MAARRVVVAALLVASVAVASADSSMPWRRHWPLSDEPDNAKNDGMPCAVCVILVGLLDGAGARAEEVSPHRFCRLVPSYLRKTCHKSVTGIVGDIRAYAREETPEERCAAMGHCTGEYTSCKLWGVDLPAVDVDALMQTPDKNVRRHLPDLRSAEWKWENLANHLPARDDDDDWFSPILPLRGGAWRGRDCDDANGQVYPGRADASGLNPSVDHNCNGISGVDPATGVPYEDSLCKGTGQRGIVVLGDSISAHFHIPFYNYTRGTYVRAALNELDYPQCSWATGFATEPIAHCALESPLPIQSVYKQLRARNRCNHRDFQNISRNGARSSSLYNDLVVTVARDQQADHPALVFYAMMANDVCNGHPGTSRMTPPDEFRANVMLSLGHLNSILPAGSYVVLMSHMHGELMWDTMATKQHLIGTTYGALWDFIGCVGVSPCWGWLTSDADMRNATTAWAESLNDELRDIVATQTFDSFKMIFLEAPDNRFVRDWKELGNDPTDLYELVDGGHPSLVGETLYGQYVYDDLLASHPEVLGPVNPNNDLIDQLFGDQGGY